VKENRDRFVDGVLAAEPGWVEDPRDRGGPTKLGVTLATLAAWRKREVTLPELKALQAPEASDLYRALFWNAVKGDDLPGGIDVYAAVFAVLSGPRRAAKVMQQTLGLPADDIDGYVGPVTIQAARAVAPLPLLDDYHEAHVAYLRTLPEWPRWGGEWTTRCERIRRKAEALLPAEAPALTAKRDGQRGTLAAAAGIASTVLLAVAAAWPAAQLVYEETLRSTSPALREVAPAWMPVALALVAAGCTLWLRARSARLAAQEAAP
jgi:lysozyme family protein